MAYKLFFFKKQKHFLFFFKKKPLTFHNVHRKSDKTLESNKLIRHRHRV